MRRILLAAVGTVLLADAYPVHAQQRPPAAEARAATDRLVRAYMRDQRVPGVSIAIVVGDRLVYVRGFGWASLEDSVPVSTQTLFPSASTAKLLTATAVAQLVERGALALDQPIETHCPAYPPKRWPVTLGQLLVHQGGVRPSGAADVFNRVHYGSVQAAVAAFAGDTLVAPPGTKEIYSNAGYVLLACTVEGASGEPFDRYLRTHVLRPAGMNATQQASLYRVVAHRSGAYMVRTAANTRAWEGLWTPAHLAETELDVPFRADPVDESFATGASNYLTSPSDLARLMIALNGDGLLGRDMRKAMFSGHPTADGKSTGRGFGWLVSPSKEGVVARLAGSVWTGSSAVLFLPDRRFAAVVSTNLGFQQPGALLDSLAAAWGYRAE
jgi:CubicO group peptidase (beta-lactamase class C family)